MQLALLGHKQAVPRALNIGSIFQQEMLLHALGVMLWEMSGWMVHPMILCEPGSSGCRNARKFLECVLGSLLLGTMRCVLPGHECVMHAQIDWITVNMIIILNTGRQASASSKYGILSSDSHL